MIARIAGLVMLGHGFAMALGVSSMRCENEVQPLGIDRAQPQLAWILEGSRRGERQTAYQVLAASSADLLARDQGDLWDSGKVVSGETLGIAYAGKALVSGQRVWWKVRVWDGDDRASAYGSAQWWEMGLLERGDWRGKWISGGGAMARDDEGFYQPQPAPLLRKGFALPAAVKRARLYVAGLGYHEVSLNGRKVGDQVLEPAWTCFGKRIFYASHDVTAMLVQGDNAVGLTLGNGWFNPLPLRMWGHLNLREHLAVGRPCGIVQLNVELVDGSKLEIASDGTWRAADGPVVSNNIYLGEVYDARKEIAGWNKPGMDDRAWRAATVEPAPGGRLQSPISPPVRATEKLPVVKQSEPKPGVFIYDFGQNFTGVVRLRVAAAAGTRVVLRYGELLHADGTLNPMTSVCGQIKGMRKDKNGAERPVGGPGAPEVAWQSDCYITKGEGVETYLPAFTYHGFRYVEITGLPKAPAPDDLTGLRLHSDVKSVGSFECSNPMFNRVQEMCRRTFVSNLVSVQSDCPHRERFGYGGDIVGTSDALLLNYDMAGFYQKTVVDWADSALPDGRLTDTAPFVGIDYCGVGWAMTHPWLVAQLYQYHGDRRLVAEQYQVGRKWLLRVQELNPTGVVRQGLGDHEALVKSPAPAVVTPMYFHSARMLSKLAAVLGNKDDAARFDQLAGDIRAAYQKEFIDAQTGAAGNGSQTCQAVALWTGLVPEGLRARALAKLLDDIRGERQGHLSTGILGTRLMLEVLDHTGNGATAYQIANQNDFPGWGWMLANGATTLWEHWKGSDNTYSNNHPMFGSVSQWFFNGPGGIRPAADAVGFDKIEIAPQVVGDLSWVKASYQSARGPVACDWQRAGGNLEVRVVVPVGTVATLRLPAADAGKVSEGGKPARDAEGVRVMPADSGTAVFGLVPGTYQFAVAR